MAVLKAMGVGAVARERGEPNGAAATHLRLVGSLTLVKSVTKSCVSREFKSAAIMSPSSDYPLPGQTLEEVWSVERDEWQQNSAG
jgi:hypothetical protein